MNNTIMSRQRDSEQYSAFDETPGLGYEEIEVSVVVPVYRSALTLPELHRRVVVAAVFDQYDFEVVREKFNRCDNSTVQFW